METETKALPVNLNALANQFPDSHKIHAYEFHQPADQPTGTLYVQFKSNANKTTYAYTDFSPEEAAELDAAASKGKHLNREWTAAHPNFDRLPGTTQEVVWPSKTAGEKTAD